MKGFVVLWVAALSTAVLAGVPECHYDMYECINTFNPQFSDLMQRRFDGDFKLIRENPTNQDVYCDLDNWIKRSELCGPCAYTFEFTSGVPAEYIGLQHCVGAMEKTPYIEESNMDIASPYNGKEMRVVTHTGGGGCSTSDYGDADLTDTIGFYNYMDSFGCGGGIAGGARVQRKLGNKLSVFLYTFHHALYENEPWRLRASSKDIEDVVMMQAKADAQDLPILKLLKAATGEVRGKFVYHCGADKPRANLEVADFSEFAGGNCPYWFLSDGICLSNPDPAKRLCTGCPLMMHNPDTEEELGCLWQPELLPMRRHNNMMDVMEFPLQENVLFIDLEALPDKEYMCDFDKWDVDLVRGRIVAFRPPTSSRRCSRPDYAFLMMKAGVRAWVVPDSRRIHGVGRNIELPIGSMTSVKGAMAVEGYLRETGSRIDSYTFEVELLFQKPAPVVWNDTPVPVELEAELTVDTDTKALMEEPVAVIGVVVLSLGAIALVAKLVHMHRHSTPLPEASGIPLGLSSTLLSASLAVLLAIVTFILADSAGKDAERAQRENKEEAVKVMVLREDRIANDLTELFLQTAAGALEGAIDTSRRRLRAAAGMVNGIAPFSGEATCEAWGTRTEYLDKAHWHKETLRYTTGVVLQVFMHSGWYWDEFRVQNDPKSHMLNGTQLTLCDTNQPYQHTMWRNTPGWEEYFEPSVHDPFKRMWWTDLPPQFTSIVQFNHDPEYRSGGLFTFRMYVGDYQAMPITALDLEGKLNSPFYSVAYNIQGSREWDSGELPVGLMVLSFPADELAKNMQEVIDDELVRNRLAENLTYVMHTEDGLVVTADTDREDAWRTVDYFGLLLHGASGFSAGMQRGFQLFTLFDSLEWEFNAYAHFLLSKYGRLDAKAADGQVIVGTFRARDYYRGYRTGWMWFPFDGAVGEAGWHVWDTWTECEGGGSGCVRFDTGHNGRGQALYLDGTGAVRVSPYLTQRVPRVARRRVGGVVGYQSTLDYYNNTMPWGGVDDVIVTQRNARPSVQGERWEPVVREKVFMKNDYSVSVWVKRSQADGKGIIFADSVTPDTNLRVYEDGSVVISIVSYGCRTAAVRNLPVGEWVFLTAAVRFARRRSMGYCAMYVDGVRRTKSPMGERVPMTYVAHNYSIGHKYTGHIDDLRVHNLTLSAGQVQELMRTDDARWIPDQQLTFALHVTEQADEHRPGFEKRSLVALIIPQEDIVRDSLANAAKMSIAVSAQDQVTQDNLSRRNTATWLLVFAIMLLFVLIFVTFNAVLTRPFAQFAREILRVSEADVEGIARIQEGGSLLQEINVMSGAINVLVTNMREYKAFMPEAIFAREPAPFAEPDPDTVPGIDTGRAAVVFTDIQGSTALWEACPEGMAVGLRVHNATMREQILAFDGYEVKTIGDAFMVAFADADHAIDFSLAAQEGLVRATWPEPLMELPQCARDAAGHGGLRVRIGCTFGDVNVELNEVLRRYDYFGPTVNRAARLEAQGMGGGVVVEEAVVDTLQSVREGRAVVVPLGKRTLKGFSSEVPLVLLAPKSLGVRQAFVPPPGSPVRKPLNPLVREQDLDLESVGSDGSMSLRQSLRRTNLNGSMQPGFEDKLSEIGTATVGFIDDTPLEGRGADLTTHANMHLARVITSLGRTDGRLLNVCGTAALVSWNVLSPCVGHVEGALRFVHMMLGSMQQMHCGLCCGTVFTGCIGTKGQRFVTAVGPCVQACIRAQARALTDDRPVMLVTQENAVATAVTERSLAFARGGLTVGTEAFLLYEVDCTAVAEGLSGRAGLFGCGTPFRAGRKNPGSPRSPRSPRSSHGSRGFMTPHSPHSPRSPLRGW